MKTRNTLLAVTSSPAWAAPAGKLVGWGNNFGVEDDGTADVYYGQATVPAGNDFVAIAAGGAHSLALKSDGSLAAWGSNYGIEEAGNADV